MVSVKFLENLFVEGRATSLSDSDSMRGTNLVELSACSVKSLLVKTDALDADLGVLVDAVADGPLDDSKVDAV